MKKDTELMFDEELFAGLKNKKKVPVRKGRGRRKKSANDLFAEVKVKMVMRIYGVTKARALEILAERAEEKDNPPVPDGNADVVDDGDDDEEDGEFMSASDFFGII